MRKSKKGISLLLICILMILSIGCTKLKNDVVDAENMKVAYIVQKGTLDDKALNELGYKGIKRGEIELGIKYEILEGNIDKEEQIQKKLKKLTEKNELIIIMGHQFNDVTGEVAAGAREKKFVVINGETRESNIQSITLRTEEGGFLMGVIAGKESKTNNVAFVGIENDSTTERLLAGYSAGVKVTNPEATKKLLSGENVIYIGNEIDVKKAKNVAKQLYKDGADIIFESVGKSAEGIFKAAKLSGKYAIGMGTDNKIAYDNYSKNIISSMIVKTDEIVYKAIKDANDGVFKSGEGNSVNYGLKEDMISVAPSTEFVVDSETYDLIMKYKNDIINEKISLPKTRNEVIEFKVE